MKIGVLSDIHGNYEALMECLKELKKRKVDAYCFLGDYVGELPQNRKVLALLMKYSKRKNCYIVRGNKEEYQINGLGERHPEWDNYPSVVGMLRYGRSELTGKEMEFIEKLPKTAVVAMDGMEEILLCHASPEDCKRPAYGKNGGDREVLSKITQNYILFGHIHTVGCYEWEGKKVYNPGSVGLQLNGKTCATCMILHSVGRQWEPEVLSVEYDYEKVIERMKEKQFYDIAPYWTKVTEQLLRGGRICHGTVLKLAMEKCFLETGECEWPRVPEKYMEAAYTQLIGSH